MYEIVEKANQEHEVRYESQLVYISSCIFPRYESGAPRNRFQSGEWINETILAGRIRANNLTINPYDSILVIQTIGTDNNRK